MHDVIFIRVSTGLSALQSFLLRLIAAHHELIRSKFKVRRETEVLVLSHWHIHTARLVHRQKDWSERKCRNQSADENRDLLVLRRRANEETRL